MFRSTRWYTRELERRERAWAAERAGLVSTICHLAGKPLPADKPAPRAPVEPEQVGERWTLTPEQNPV